MLAGNILFIDLSLKYHMTVLKQTEYKQCKYIKITVMKDSWLRYVDLNCNLE